MFLVLNYHNYMFRSLSSYKRLCLSLKATKVRKGLNGISTGSVRMQSSEISKDSTNKKPKRQGGSHLFHYEMFK